MRQSVRNKLQPPTGATATMSGNPSTPAAASKEATMSAHTKAPALAFGSKVPPRTAPTPAFATDQVPLSTAQSKKRTVHKRRSQTADTASQSKKSTGHKRRPQTASQYSRTHRAMTDDDRLERFKWVSQDLPHGPKVACLDGLVKKRYASVYGRTAGLSYFDTNCQAVDKYEMTDYRHMIAYLRQMYTKLRRSKLFSFNPLIHLNDNEFKLVAAFAHAQDLAYDAHTQQPRAKVWNETLTDDFFQMYMYHQHAKSAKVTHRSPGQVVMHNAWTMSRLMVYDANGTAKQCKEMGSDTTVVTVTEENFKEEVGEANGSKKLVKIFYDEGKFTIVQARRLLQFRHYESLPPDEQKKDSVTLSCYLAQMTSARTKALMDTMIAGIKSGRGRTNSQHENPNAEE